MSVKINERANDFILIFKSLFPFLLKNTRESVEGFKVVLYMQVDNLALREFKFGENK